jgi:hypothetical protein
MIAAIVQFKLPRPISPDEARNIFLTTAPKYRDVPGLIRKYYLLSDDGASAGGVYFWQSRKQAEQLYTEEWRQFIREKYGSEPGVTYFESPVIVDNLAGEIRQEV